MKLPRLLNTAKRHNPASHRDYLQYESIIPAKLNLTGRLYQQHK